MGLDTRAKKNKNATGTKNSLFSPVGTSGLPRYAGYVFDEWLPELQGPRGRKVLREMSDNSAAIGALKFAMEMLIREVSWTVAPGTDDNEGHDAATFVFEAMHDMEVPWEETLADILSMTDYGWSLFEQVYKKRDGKASKYDDGRIGWAGWQMRGQETLLHWEWEDFHSNFPKAFVQLGPPDFIQHTIPMDKCLLFRTTTRRANPEGRSLWRNAYHSWYMAKHLEAIEAIGAERDMAGFPVGRVPGEILDNDASDEQKAMAASWLNIVTNIRRDEQEGVLIPSDLYEDTETPMWDLQLLTTGGQRQFNLGEVISRHENRMLMTCLGDFIMFGNGSGGTGGGGSQSLGKTKIELFCAAITSILGSIAAQINDIAIPRLLKLNGMSIKNPPTLQHGQVERMDLDVLGNYIYQLGQAGFVLDTNPQGALANHLLEQAHLPPPPEGLQNPFPDQWAGMMPNPPGMPPSPGNFAPPPMGPGPGQWKGVVQEKGNIPGQNPPGTGGQQQQIAGPTSSGPKRPSLKEPNMPDAPKAKPPFLNKTALQSNGALATAHRRRAARQFSEGEADAISKTFAQIDIGTLKVVAFDLDNTALRFPNVFVPVATILANAGVKVGIMTGNNGYDAMQMWGSLGYPIPDFYLAHDKGEDQESTAQWKAEQCKKLGVDLLVDDFSGGRYVGIFNHFTQQLGGGTVALEVVLPPNTAHQHV